MMQRYSLAFLLSAFVSLGISDARADAITIDFEGYPPGAIANGFDGWQITNPGWDQEVVNTNPISGSQSWRISRQVTSGSFGDQPFTPALSQKAGESSTGAASNFFSASWLVKPTVDTPLDGDGITVSIDNGTGQRGNWIDISGSGGLWALSVFDYDGAAFVQTALGSLATDVATKIGFTLQFNDGLLNDVWQVFVNDALVFTGVGWEDFFTDGAPTFGSAPAIYDRLLFRASGNAVNGATGLLIDDISYTTDVAAVPEPGTLALLGVGLAGLALVARRRAA